MWVGKWTAKKGKYYFYDKTQQEPKPTYQQPARVDEWIGGPRAKESSFKEVESTLPVGADHVEEASERRESAKRRERVKSMRQQHAAPASPLSPASAAVWVGKYSEKKRTYYYYDETQPGVKPTFTQPAQVGKWIGGPRAAQGAAPAPAAAAVAVTPSATPSPSAAGAAPLAEAAASAPEEAGPPLRSALSDYVCPLAAPLTESRPGPPGWYWVHFDRDEPKWGSATCNADGCGEVLRYSSGQGPLRYHALGHDFRPPSSSAPRSPPRARPQARAPSQERRASRDCSDR